MDVVRATSTCHLLNEALADKTELANSTLLFNKTVRKHCTYIEAQLQQTGLRAPWRGSVTSRNL